MFVRLSVLTIPVFARLLGRRFCVLYSSHSLQQQSDSGATEEEGVSFFGCSHHIFCHAAASAAI
jgi:hypothetical protein